MITGKPPFPLLWAARRGKAFLGFSNVEREVGVRGMGPEKDRIAVCVHGRGKKRKGERKRDREGE